MCFISQGSNFCWFTTQEWQQSVFDQKRERGFDEPLVYNLKFKQKYWVPLVGGNVNNCQPSTNTRSRLSSTETLL